MAGTFKSQRKSALARVCPDYQAHLAEQCSQNSGRLIGSIWAIGILAKFGLKRRLIHAISKQLRIPLDCLDVVHKRETEVLMQKTNDSVSTSR